MEIITVKHKAIRKMVRDASLTAVKGLDPFEFTIIAQQIAAIRVMTHPRQLVENFPNWRAHEWKGRAGYWSLDVTGNRRLLFHCDIAKQQVSLLDYRDPH
ncbi:hypothetical protein [Alteraurantiacibacter palmitatis]|uniref:Type II toxin-antitoxin system RelE/ParE family toxin n=1 Tax=Alteraurantiacibacter palmitatis TaxID=2054628 RepID=A0ABV7E682_9SPHN